MADRKVALLRGINVGKAKRVAMADLRALIGGLGYHDVRTILNSGNVVFTALGTDMVNSSARIEEALSLRLGVSARVTVLDSTELATVITENPLGDVADDPSRLLVTVLANPADRTRIIPLTQQDWAPEALAVGTRVAYLWCPDGILASQLVKAVDRVLGDAATSRNWATILKLYTLIETEGK